MISDEEKKIILRRKPLPQYYISLRHMFPSVYFFIKKALFKKLKENNDITEDVIYDYKTDNIWLTKQYFYKYSSIFIGFIQNETFEKYQNVIYAQHDLSQHLYARYIRIRNLSYSELNHKIKEYKNATDEDLKCFYEYCYYDRISRFLPVRLFNRFLFLVKAVPRHIYHEKGRQIIKES